MTGQRLIGFAGPAGAGKSSAAAVLMGQGWLLVSFAEPLKVLAAELLGVDLLELEDRKRAGDGQVRRYLRTCGDWARAHGDLLLSAAASRIEAARAEGLPVVIDDVRLPIEAALVRELGGALVHVQREGVFFSHEHATEYGPGWEPGDFVIVNDGSVRALASEVTRLLDDLRCLAEIRARTAA